MSDLDLHATEANIHAAGWCSRVMDTPEDEELRHRVIATIYQAIGPDCHCGQPCVYGYDGDPTHTRGLCEHCDARRCDAYPGECGR